MTCICQNSRGQSTQSYTAEVAIKASIGDATNYKATISTGGSYTTDQHFSQKPVIYNGFVSLKEKTTIPIRFYLGNLSYSGIYTKLKTPAFTTSALSSITTAIQPGLAINVYSGTSAQPFSSGMTAAFSHIKLAVSSFADGTAIGAFSYIHQNMIFSTAWGRFNLTTKEPTTWYSDTRYFADTWTYACIVCLQYTKPFGGLQYTSTTYGAVHQSPFVASNRYWLRQESVFTTGPLRLLFAAFAQDTYITQHYQEEPILIQSSRLHTIAQGLGSVIYTQQQPTQSSVLQRIGIGVLYSLKQDDELYTNTQYKLFYTMQSTTQRLFVSGSVKNSSQEKKEYTASISYARPKAIGAPVIKLSSTHLPETHISKQNISLSGRFQTVPTINVQAAYGWNLKESRITEKTIVSSFTVQHKTKFLIYSVKFALNLCFY